MLGTSGPTVGGINHFFDGTQPCSQTDPEIFFPEITTSNDVIRAAIKICSTCEFKVKCLEIGLKTQSFGIWGGTTHIQRKRMTRYAS